MLIKKLFPNIVLAMLVLTNFVFVLPSQGALALAKSSGSEDAAQGFAAGQTLPWGMDRIDADKTQGLSSGAGIKVAILDSGIDLEHPDLAGRVKGGFNALNPGGSYDDDFGHGTHVAGIVAALNNDIGTVGVAPLADLYAVKVLDNTGNGSVSDIIRGINWATDNGMQVINLSFTISSDVLSLHDAIINAAARGAVVVVAAGNGGGTAKHPGAYPEVIAVGALDQSGILASWSSRGPEIDLLAPGASVYSTYAGGIYKYMRGTSMAAPYVSGTAAPILSPGNFTAEEVKAKLLDSAENLSSGYKLVDAENAVATAGIPASVPTPSGAPIATLSTQPTLQTAVVGTPAPVVAGHGPGTLINMNGTNWRITDDGLGRQGFDTLEKFQSHRLKFSNVFPADSTDIAKPDAGLMAWGEGVLFNDTGTVYQISGGEKHGFTSAGVF